MRVLKAVWEAFTEAHTEAPSLNGPALPGLLARSLLRLTHCRKVWLPPPELSQLRTSNCRPGSTKATACCGLLRARDWLAEIEIKAKIWLGTKLADAGTEVALARIFVMRKIAVLLLPGATIGIPAQTTEALSTPLAAVQAGHGK